MVLPVQTFTDPRLAQPIQPHGLNLALQSGMQFAGQLQKMQQAAAMAPLSRQLTQAETQQYLAKAMQERALSKSPFAGKILPGPAGRSQGMKMLTDMLGKDSPYVKTAWKDYDADMKMKLGRAQYYTANTILKNVPLVNKMQIMENYQNEQAARTKQGQKPQTFKEWYQRPENQAGTPQSTASNLTPNMQGGGAPITSTTPTPAEQAIAGTQQVQPGTTQPGAQIPPSLTPAGQPQGAQPGGAQPQMPQATAQAGLAQEPFEMEARQTGVGITTKTHPTFVLQKLSFARNIQKTLKRMPEKAITAYSENPAKLANDYRKSLEGDITPDYAEYLKFVTNAKFLSTQTRQFYQDTIQPNMLKRLDNMTNPISWRTNPKAALISYHAMTGTLGKEINTYIDEASDPRFIDKMRKSKVLRGQTIHGTIPAKKKRVATQLAGWDKAGTIYTAKDGSQHTWAQLQGMKK